MANETTMNFRIDAELKQAFELVAKDYDQTPSQLIRAFIRQTVKDHAEKQPHRGPAKPQGKEETGKPKHPPQKLKKPAKSTGNPLLDKMLPRIGK